MTQQSGQSGQGEGPHLPQARQAHEGVVLPADGGEPLLPGAYGDRIPQPGPAGATPWGQPWGPESQQAQAAQPMPTYEWGEPQQPSGALPPQAPAQALPQQHAPAGPMPQAAPQGAYDADATQYIAPQPAGAADATQYMPPAGAADATQYMPPQTGAAPLPPETPAESTQFLGRALQQPMPQQPMPGALPDAVPGGPAGADSEATQYIPPVPGQPQAAPYGIRPGAPGDRQPPAEFDALFRTEPEGAAASTQQMPRFDPHTQNPHAQNPQNPQNAHVPPVQPQGYEPEPVARGKGRAGTGSRGPLIAAVGVGILVLGIGAGALLGGGDDDKKSDTTTTVSDSSSAPSESASPSADPAKEQAVALDKLLAESNNSRSAVVRSVANIGACKELPAAAKDLRDAATQRNDLVTQLSALAVDKLPDHAQLTDALTRAWKASASADSHYAAWADQVGGNGKLCHKGHARSTPQRRAGDTASGTASQQKARASKLWNGIASQYGLTQRSAVQL
ncbi:hypothetical protein [Streptomyces sp. VRA16 Mangrove soil]|uniref:hypothetical protein n=1 Tax=Streptomyces sp. VRA16 Mangrove soil TaxID=2817434 RepID=UPI001A9E6F86|nr:hypothetical protein [Streptomyces sp. VRA16 Mangrove soil]MBO1337647.1 hypothetical protein [Streptomyces sp. VRA16 Mangrove soil]